MYNLFLQITEYCDDMPDDPDKLHNRWAPTTHNKLCKGKSVWKVGIPCLINTWSTWSKSVWKVGIPCLKHGQHGQRVCGR